MVGIESCGLYVPIWRLDLASAGKGKGERSVASYDEDSLTMSVAAGINCLRGIDRSTVDGVFFASATSPFKEKQVSVTIATALDLKENIITSDFGNSLRAGTNALKAALDAVKAGSANRILVVVADLRVPMAGSDFEKELGDGAVAFLVSANPALIFKGSSAVIEEIYDVWRTDDDKYLRSWEERFGIDEGYTKSVSKAVSSLLEKNALTAKDISKAAFYGPNKRRVGEVGRKLGFAPEQLPEAVFNGIGDTGNACSLMLLASVLPAVKAGEKLVLASYGNGAEALLWEAAKPINVTPTLQQYLDSKVLLKDYKKYLNWRGILEMVTGRRRPPLPSPSATCIWRDSGEIISLKGVKCQKCGYIQFPPQRVCFKCHTKDQFESYRFSDKPATLTTYTEDMTSPNPDPPVVFSVLDFAGGGRMWAYMTDRGGKEVQIGMPLEMTFRKIFTSDGIHNYYWKCMPTRFNAGEAK